MLTLNNLVFLSLAVVVIGGPIQKHTVTEDDTKEAELLSSKLARLKTLLRELQKEDDQVAVQEKTTKATTTQPPPEVTSYLSDVKEPMSDSFPNDSKDMEEFVESLSPRDIEELKILKSLLEKAREQEEDELAKAALPKGVFKEKAVPETEEGAKDVIWRDLARQFQTERDQLILNKRKPAVGIDHDHVDAYTEEGAFGSFRNEIKQSVEKNLLTDIALAIDSGIPVDEIIHDLTKGEYTG